MGVDFLALIQHSGDREILLKGIADLERESPPELRQIPWQSLESGIIYGTDPQPRIWLEDYGRSEESLRRESPFFLPGPEVTLLLPEDFYLTFHRDVIHVYHLLEWSFFATDLAWQKVMLDACGALCRLFDARDCIITTDYSSFHCAVRDGVDFETALQRRNPEEVEWKSLAEICVEEESEEIVVSPSGQTRRINPNVVPWPGWRRERYLTYRYEGFWRYHWPKAPTPMQVPVYVPPEREPPVETTEPPTPELVYDPLYPVSSKGKYGYIDKEGNVVIDLQFQLASMFVDGTAVVRKEDTNYYINHSGEILTVADPHDFGHKWPDHWEPMRNQEPTMILASEVYHPPAGFVCVEENQQLVLAPEIEEVRELSEGLAPVRIQNQWGFVNEKGELVIDAIYDGVTDFVNSYAIVWQSKLCGFINRQGEQMIPCQFDEARHFVQGVARVSLNRRWGYINERGEYLWRPRD